MSPISCFRHASPIPRCEESGEPRGVPAAAQTWSRLLNAPWCFSCADSMDDIDIEEMSLSRGSVMLSSLLLSSNLTSFPCFCKSKVHVKKLGSLTKHPRIPLSPTARTTFSNPLRWVNIASRKHVVPLFNISAIVSFAAIYPSSLS